MPPYLAQGEPSPSLTEVLSGGLTAGDWITAGAVLGVAIVAGRVLQAVVRRVLARGDGDATVATLVARFAGNLVIVAGVVYALAAVEVDLLPLVGALGVGSLALAFAAQSILENTFASIVLRTRRPFRRGDQIRAGDVEGVVEDVTLRVVVVRSYDGERVEVPAAQVLRNPIYNETFYGQRRTTLEVGVAYDTNLARARAVLLGAVGGIDGVAGDPEPEVWVHRFSDSSIDFALRYWHAPDNATKWRVRSGVVQAVKAALDEAGITIPFPQRTLSYLEPAAPPTAGAPLSPR